MNQNISLPTTISIEYGKWSVSMSIEKKGNMFYSSNTINGVKVNPFGSNKLNTLLSRVYSKMIVFFRAFPDADIDKYDLINDLEKRLDSLQIPSLNNSN